MNSVSRRQFLARLAVSSATLLATRSALASARISNRETFEMLVVGDSLMSAQGLKLENKFYYLTKEWLQSDVFGEVRKVNLKVKAHSGARIALRDDEMEELARAGDNARRFHHPEINLSFPSITRQVQMATREYDDPAKVNMILMSGGITDVLVANAVNPFLKEYKLRALINRYCRRSMNSLLYSTATTFPKAQIFVVGYFPIISTMSDAHQITRYLFKTVKFPHPLQFMLANPLSKQFMKLLRDKMAARSILWTQESDRAQQAAIGDVNRKLDNYRIHFVRTPITAEHTFATKESWLWGSDEDNLPADEMYATRKIECSKAFDEIQTRHYGKLTTRMCELAAIGHPNVEGSRAYFQAIKEVVAPTLLAEENVSRRCEQ